MKGVLVDLTKCIGCSSCTVACKMYNDNKWVDEKAPTSGENAKLADENWTVIKKCNVKDHSGKEVWRFAKHQCLHCKDPACVTACLSKAFQKTEEGPVVYYPGNCIGCRYCMIGCPFDIPKFEWDSPLPVMSKCMMCYGRVTKGESPACVSVCPTNVMKYGDHDELLAEAKDIVAKENSKYIKHIYGEKEAGGTSWIYISDTPFDKLGFKPHVPQKPLPEVVKPFMHSSPILGGIWFLILSGLYIFTKRRQNVKEVTQAAPKQVADQPEQNAKE